MFTSKFDYSEVQKAYQQLVLPLHGELPPALKPQQAEAIHGLVSGLDLLLLLPTGFGKSLVFIVPGVLKSIEEKRQSVTVVVAPLIALINNFLRNMELFKLSAKHVTTISDLDDFNEDPAPQRAVFLFISPEVLVKHAIRRGIFSLKPDILIVDEGHVVADWGNTFRKDYSSLYEVRALTHCPLGVFTATLTPGLVNDVVEKTGLKEFNMLTIAVSPNRPNIFLEMMPASSEYDQLTNIAMEVKEMQLDMQKTIIFVNSVTVTFDMFLWFRGIIGQAMVHKEGNKKIGFIVNFYSAETETGAKTEIETEFNKPNGYVRCVISTIAFSLGVDIPDVRRVIIWGQPTTPSSFWQEIGRAGRDGNPATAVVYPFKSKGIDYKKHPFDLQIKGCIREYVLNFFVKCDFERCEKDKCCSNCKNGIKKIVDKILPVGLMRRLNLK